MRDFNDYVLKSFDSNGPLLQPRLGFSTPAQMHEGLQATASCNANTVCTITLDAFTRVNDFAAAQKAISEDQALNGYPIVNHPLDTTQEMVQTVYCVHGKPVQIRHGSPDPVRIFERMTELGLNATEGGPISYCLPYSRTPLREAFSAWRKACNILAIRGKHSHVETFAGCMMGQMCDPSILIALNILEGLFLKECGIESLSFSYAQGTSPVQDVAAVTALQHLAKQFFPDTPYHFVSYVFMGYFPKTLGGFYRITQDALSVIRSTGVQRVILKTPVESRRIPSIKENIAALEFASYCLKTPQDKPEPDFDLEEYERIFETALSLILQTLALEEDLSEAILAAFQTGVLSVPYCLHPDNRRVNGTILTSQNYYRMYSDEKVDNAFSLLSSLQHNIHAYDRV